ncbi:nuclear pore complex protein NUP98A isoform X1 [Nicotiana tomentosiformis]|uniref:nuclear pore complex protein NUP98A isoform X1 n=1 Tax=Nicotiana tomentosiformis TaxID=4098 RepID=UPI00051AC28F|nr:nuclear pore complex protein NUP98A isoform X1 [Nicotiana tomentosiformis]XP_009596898.1 nuclear pore complex protein NUP98A isoform X1 [Nicotiana tomentosiformis]
MFGSTNAFGQSSTSPFGSQSGFGQTSNNPFAPKPFGSTNPFGSQSGGSFFGSTSTGVFGTPQSSSPLGSTPVFGASSSPAFGSTTPAFGASSTPTFGSSSSAFGSSSVFGQKPAFGGFGSSSAQTSPFGSSFQQSQPAFGSGLFGSSAPFGASSQPAFGTPSTPTFGSSSTPAFGATSAPAFGTSSTPAFGSTPNPAFGSTASPFGASNSPIFGSSTPAFGATSTPAFGATGSPAFGATTTPAFGAPSAPSFSFGSAPAFGQSTSAFGSSPFGTSTSTFGAQSSAFGAQTSAATFGSPGFAQSAVGGQRGGTRVAAYQATPEADSGSGTQPAGKLESISAMPVYRDKSHEELRWEDYQLGDKGGPASAGQSTSGINFGSSAFASSSTSPFGQSSSNPFSSTTTSNPFAPKPPAFSPSGFGTSATPTFSSSPFASSNASNPFGSTSSTTPSLFGPSAPAFGTNTSPSLFGSSSASGFGSSTSIFGSSSAQATAPAFGPSLSFGNTQSSPLFQSTTPSFGQTSSAFGQTASSFAQSTPAFGQSNLFSTPSTGFGGNLFSSAPLLNTSNPIGFGQTTPSLSTPFQLTQPSQSTAFGFSNYGQAQGGGASGFGGTPSLFSQPSANQSSVVAQPAVVTNPFGTLPAMPQMSIGRTGTSSSIQYGISSLPVVDKPVPVRISSLLTSRHLSQRRVRLPARKYHPKTEGAKVPFFSDDEETPSTPKADALFVPRENPRALVIRPLDQWPSRGGFEKVSPSKHTSPAHENGKIPEVVFAPVTETSAKDKNKDLVENGLDKEGLHSAKLNQKPNGLHERHHLQKGAGSSITLTGHRAGEAAIVYEHGADIEALMPKLRHSDYYTEPRVQELAAKERAEPGFCRHVKDFVVGRHEYGSIKFIGETDVRRLDLESLIQFNNREVIVYMDESKKPPVGQGLNKPAEVTLLNIKCFDKKTGQHYTEGPRIDKYKDMLKRKAGDQGAEFVSYDPVKGEWKFRVQHFSKYRLQEDNEDECGEYCFGNFVMPSGKKNVR